jgi:hypothetical protein
LTTDRGKLDPAKPANEVITDFGAELPPLTVVERKPTSHASASISANYREAIELVRTAGREPAAYPTSQRRRREKAEGHSAPRYTRALLTKTWWGQLMPTLCTS